MTKDHTSLSLGTELGVRWLKTPFLMNPGASLMRSNEDKDEESLMIRQPFINSSSPGNAIL